MPDPQDNSGDRDIWSAAKGHLPRAQQGYDQLRDEAYRAEAFLQAARQHQFRCLLSGRQRYQGRELRQKLLLLNKLH